MKIGILTLPLHTNYGGILQAYALQTVLERMGHEVVVLDKSPYHYLPLWKMPFSYPKRILEKYVLGKKSVKVFAEQWYNRTYPIISQYTQTFIDTYIHRKEVNDLTKLDEKDFDALVVGSDQIWNFYASLSPVYMLDFVPFGKKKIAYAASMGQCRLDESLYEVFKKRLLSFDAISLREKNGVEFVNALLKGEKLVYQTLDPTLLIDSKAYDKIIDDGKIKIKNYICTYILAELDKENFEIIRAIKSLLGLDIINLRNPDTCIWLSQAQNTIVTPYKWLYYIKNSDFVICSSFHAVVFSLIFHKPFIALVPPRDKNKGGNMRINTLLEDMGLLNRIIDHFDLKQIQNILKESINWGNIETKILQLRDLSIEFLANNLK